MAFGLVDKQGFGRLIELGCEVDALALARGKIADRRIQDGLVEGPELMDLGKVHAGPAG